MNKTLYISDMDGTLLDRDSKVSQETAAIISRLSREGALITVATARTPATVVPLLERTFTLPPAIVMTGAALWDRGREYYSDVHFIRDSERQAVIEVCHFTGLHPFVYVMEGKNRLTVYHDGDVLNAAEQSFYDERMNLRLKSFKLHCRVPDERQTVLWYAMGHHERVFEAAAELRKRSRLSLSCYYDIFDKTIAHLEIFAHGVSKALAVEQLKRQTGADRVVVFGDNLNDIPMMEVADCGIAVGNAFDEVKAKADIVIGPNYENSVARFIEKDFEPVRK